MPEGSEPPLIVLVGAPGAGKSTVGALLAQRLGVDFFDVDTVIAEQAGKSVADIFAEEGEPAFRSMEERTTAELLGGTGVLALGGGAILSERTRALLHDHHVVWLQVSVGQAVDRVGMNQARPLLLGNVRGRLITLLAERTPLYTEVATQTVDTDGHQADAVIELIMEQARG